KGSDGIYQDEANRRLELEVQGGALEQAAKPAAAVADYWHHLGIATTPVRASPQQMQDPEYVATFPAFSVYSRPNSLASLRFFYSTASRLPSNNFRVAGIGNMSRYMSAELDALIDGYFKTVPVPERTRALGQIIHHVAEQVTVVGLYYNPVPAA